MKIPYWSIPIDELFAELKTAKSGLSSSDAQLRQKQNGSAIFQHKKKHTGAGLFWRQFTNPLTLLLLFCAAVLFFCDNKVDAVIILAIISLSNLFQFVRERRSAQTINSLLARVQVSTCVLRDGREVEIALDSVVAGDIIHVKTGDIIPADCRIIESKDLFVDESLLSGETSPQEKRKGVLSKETEVRQRNNLVFMGTHVVSGTAEIVAVVTGEDSEYGRMGKYILHKFRETDFERGIRRFSYFIFQVALVVMICIFSLNVLLHKPFIESLLFALALAVGFTPQLLPAIISINLAQCAQRMAHERAIIKKLPATQSLGSMDILCADKTGTLTQGVFTLHSALTHEGEKSKKLELFSYVNSSLQTGYANPIDTAITRSFTYDLSRWVKYDEIPFDFMRKRLSLSAAYNGNNYLITKGAVDNIVRVCSWAEDASENIVPIAEAKGTIYERFRELSARGFRVVAVCYKKLDARREVGKEDESAMIFLGLLVFYDAPKDEIFETVKSLKEYGVSLKVLSGDSKHVVRYLAQYLGHADAEIMTGSEVLDRGESSLIHKADLVSFFAELMPLQKEKILQVLKRKGYVVGYLGDGVNDAPAMHTADVSIAVDSAVDVVKNTADVILLEKDLRVLIRGVLQGRISFANTLKYIFFATSTNFGNMLSMSLISYWVDFLPLLPKQILLMNIATDFPEMTISTDNVDQEILQKPLKWDMKSMYKVMLIFGSLSVIFDLITFSILLFVLGAAPKEFRTGWFIESVTSATLIIFVLRSTRMFFRSRPSRYLVATSIAVWIVVLGIPYSVISSEFGFKPLPLPFYFWLGVALGLYVLTAEMVKRRVYRWLYLEK